MPSEKAAAIPDIAIWSEVMRVHAGPETQVSVVVTGHFGPKEIFRLIRLLEAQKAVLEDDDSLAAASSLSPREGEER